MKFKKILIIAFFLCASLSSKAQYFKLLNLTEKQVKAKVTEFPIVSRDSSEHEFVSYLTFRNKDSEIQMVTYFFGGNCYLIKEFKSLESLKLVINSADKLFNRNGENRWRSKDSTFEVSILKTPERIVTSYSRGISTY